MKKQLKIIIGIVLISIIGYLGFSIGNKLNHKKEVAERIKTIPEFSFKTLNGEAFTQNEVSETLPKLFIYFNSECEFCHAEAKQIQESIEQLKNVQLLLVSFEESEGIKAFAEKYHLVNYENIIFLEDSSLLFAELFDAKSIPFMVLYSKENQLIQKFKGATKIEKVISYLPSQSADRQDSQREETK
ncbi:MAG: redoxin domain-containing protein [Flavobacteriaceae bacterium]|nr:redoxin domain-containing protein [Flavobacteriaceae bacterium]